MDHQRMCKLSPRVLARLFESLNVRPWPRYSQLIQAFDLSLSLSLSFLFVCFVRKWTKEARSEPRPINHPSLKDEGGRSGRAAAAADGRFNAPLSLPAIESSKKQADLTCLSLSLLLHRLLGDWQHRLREFAAPNCAQFRPHHRTAPPVYPVTHLQRRGTLGNHSCGLLQRLRGLLLPDGGYDLKRGRKEGIKRAEFTTCRYGDEGRDMVDRH